MPEAANHANQNPTDHDQVDPEQARQLSRRRFLSRLSIALSALSGVVVGAPILAYLLNPLLHPVAQVWRDLGPVTKFAPGQTAEVSFQDPSPLPWAGLTAQSAVWVRHNSAREDDFTVFAVNCTHLGCPINWNADGKIFLCPCHGGVFNADGTVASGPPPRPLYQYDTRVQNGVLQLKTRPLPVG